MKKQYSILFFTIYISFVVGTSGTFLPAQAATVNHEIWAELLKKYIKQDGVDYAGLKQKKTD